MTVADRWYLELRRRPALVRGALVAVLVLTAAVYAPVRGFGYVAYDDPEYVEGNVHVQAGFTWAGLRWAFTTAHTSYWHPVTWLSHMLDAAWFGPGPAAPHVVNLLLHLANTALVFLLLRRATGAAWRSLLVAAWFALHPLHVESVAWIAERKDVLSTAFFLLALGAWLRFVAAPAGRARRGWYAAALGAFALALMSKPMAVTLPCVLLLLDAWPLARLAGGAAAWRARVVEKLPFFALAAAGSAAAFLSTRTVGAVEPLAAVSLGERLANAAVAYARYLGATVWPDGLAFFYPHPGAWPAGTVALAVAALALVSAAAVLAARRAPWGLVGWAWFLGVLVPTIGLVQVGVQAMADRYMYVPALGLFIPLAWAAGAWAARRPAVRPALGLAAAVTVGACAVASRGQLAHWRDTEALCRHALAVTEGNFVAHNNLANVLQQRGELAAAAEHYRRALAARPDFAPPANNLAQVLLRLGDAEGALVQLRAAAAAQPDFAEVHSNLGNAFRQLGRLADADAAYRRALELRPDLAVAQLNLGTLRLQRGEIAAAVEPLRAAARLAPDDVAAAHALGWASLQVGALDEAVRHLAAAVALEPRYLAARAELALALRRQGRPLAAAEHYRALAELAPRNPEWPGELAWVLATAPDARPEHAAEALALARRAAELTGGEHPLVSRALAAAHAAAGDFPAAIAVAERALVLLAAEAASPLAAELRAHLEFYRAGSPLREVPRAALTPESPPPVSAAPRPRRFPPPSVPA